MNSIGEIGKHGGLGGSAGNLQDFLKFWSHISKRFQPDQIVLSGLRHRKF